MRNSSRHYGEFFVVRSLHKDYPPEALVSFLKHQKGIGKFRDCEGVIPMPLMWDLINIDNYVIVMLGETRQNKKRCFNCREDLNLKKGDILVRRAGLNLGEIIRIIE